jgi:hypothetical protein
MNRQLVFVHGRAQQHKDASALKAEWLDALHDGLAKNGLRLPIAESDIRFPYYGDTLYDLVDGKSADDAAAVIVRGEAGDAEEEEFTRAVMREIQARSGIDDAQLAAIAGQDVVEKGPLNWDWFQAFLGAVDRYVPYGSGSSIALFTHDVYQYLKNSNIRDTIDTGVSAAMTRDVATVVVAHSLGTVVAYNLLRQKGHLCGWNCVLLGHSRVPACHHRDPQDREGARRTRALSPAASSGGSTPWTIATSSHSIPSTRRGFLWIQRCRVSKTSVMCRTKRPIAMESLAISMTRRSRVASTTGSRPLSTN